MIVRALALIGALAIGSLVAAGVALWLVIRGASSDGRWPFDATDEAGA